jgi:hypothetical protein
MTLRTCVVVCFAMLGLAVAPAGAASLQDGLDAYHDNHIAEAEAALSAVVADPAASGEDRAEALRTLGRITWLARGSTDAIAAALAQTPAGAQGCETAVLALRLYREAGAPASALGAAEALRAQCPADEAEAMHTQLARTHLALAAADAGARAAQLAAAAAELAAIDQAGRSAPEIAAAAFSLALAQRDAAAALAAWRAYFWLTDADAPQAMQRYAGRVRAVFAAGLAPGGADSDVIALVTMLIRAGFVEDAQLLATQTGVAARAGDNADWRNADAYFAFDRGVRASTLRANREMAQGGHAAWYQDEIKAAMGQLMQAAGLSGDPTTALAEAYGFYGTLGETSGYPSLHAGHLVRDETLNVEQYGRRGQLRFIVIDNMIANGFESWLWDGWAQAGGWSGDDGIVQVRSAYTSSPLSALRRARPGPARDRFTARIEHEQADELAALARGHGIAVLPATGDRLDLQAIDEVAQRVGADSAAFIAEYWRLSNRYSIELHEGRHALDKATGRHFSDTDLEYRAKLSQIALSECPRLGLANVVSTTIGETAHGRANRRLMQGYRDWMRRHRGEIAGYDASAPALAQLDKLSDAQIRAVPRALDPDAREASPAR